MSSAWQWLFGKGASSSSSTPTGAIFLRLAKTNVQKISDLISIESQKAYLNPNQCRSLLTKLVKIMQNIESIARFLEMSSRSLSIEASGHFYRISEKAKELVENSCTEDWCKASTFQIQNEEAFKEILLETGLCYSSIFELAKGVNSNYTFLVEDLRLSSEFEPPSSAEVLEDQIVLLKRYKDFIDDSRSSSSCMRQVYLARHLLRRLEHVHLRNNIEDFDMSTSSLWPDGKSLDDEWGKNSDFLGGNVCKTTWLGVPCAKKVFNDGVGEEEILAEARILARLNHPNIAKFICCGHDGDNTWCHFIAMEQMERGLHSVIRKQAQLKEGAPFSLSSAVDIMLQIAYGTCYLHDHGVAHRDLKTCNVVVRQITTPHLQDYLQVKLVDFGLSKVKLSASRSNTITHPKIGTTTYMPPEAFRYGRANWFKADAYSFGVLCSVILSGEEPFQRVPRSKVYEAVCRGERPMLPPETPEELALLIKKCWDTDRNARPDFVEISSKLAEIRHSLLEDHIENYNVRATSYIQQMIRRRTDTRKSKVSFIRSQVLTNVTEEDEFFEDQVDVKEQPQELSLEPSHIAAEIPVEILLNRRPFRCQHEGCNKSFKNPQTLKMHSKTHYIGDNAASCKPISPPVLGQSLNSGRNKKIPFRCPKCRKNFVGLDELRRHYGRKHSEGEKPFACRKCGKKFYMEVDVRDHEKTCGEPMVCKCGLKFAFKCNLVAHKKAHPACQEYYQKHRSPGRNRQTSMLPSSNSGSTSCGSSFSASDSEQSMGSSYPYSNPSAKRQYEEIISPMNSQQLPQFPDFDFPLTYYLSGNFYSGPRASEGLRQDIEEIQKRQRLQLLGETALVLTSDQNPSLPVSTSENILMASPKDFSQYDFSEITEPVITHPILVQQLQTICSRVEEDLPLQSVKFKGKEEQENSHHQGFWKTFLEHNPSMGGTRWFNNGPYTNNGW